MQKRFWSLGLVALGMVSVATPSLAQDILIGPEGFGLYDRDRDHRGPPRYDRGEISEREAVRIARREGLREVDDVERGRRTLRVFGVDRRGRDIRVDIDRRTGDVLGVR